MNGVALNIGVVFLNRGLKLPIKERLETSTIE
jgi:hypothetical protein